MQRRSFIKNSALCAVVISTTGHIKFDGDHFIGDCETTTDILGPFYRANAPLRTDLVIKNKPGDIVNLSGTIFHSDCKTPLPKATVEIWHCGADGQYDNTSSEFVYRARTFADEKGRYRFRTVIPVPYEVGDGNTRPAHYHMMISAPGYQSLVTQVYFTGDPYLSKDSSSSSPAAKKRILKIMNGNNGEKLLAFDITLADKFPADAAVVDRLAGIYSGTNNGEKTEFFKRDNQLWVKYGNAEFNFKYIGNNTFRMHGSEETVNFELMKDGSIKLTHVADRMGKKTVTEAVKQ